MTVRKRKSTPRKFKTAAQLLKPGSVYFEPALDLAQLTSESLDQELAEIATRYFAAAERRGDAALLRRAKTLLAMSRRDEPGSVDFADFTKEMAAKADTLLRRYNDGPRTLTQEAEYLSAWLKPKLEALRSDETRLRSVSEGVAAQLRILPLIRMRTRIPELSRWFTAEREGVIAEIENALRKRADDHPDRNAVRILVSLGDERARDIYQRAN